MALDKVPNLDVVVRVSKSGQTEAVDQHHVDMSTDFLEDVKTRSDVKQFNDMVTLILAHEMAHTIQFRLYGEAWVRNPDDPETEKLAECQADVEAGRFIVESLSTNGPIPESRQRSILTALRVMFDLGNEGESKYDDHPSHLQRLEAVRLGMAAGLIAVLLKNGPSDALPVQILEQKLDINTANAVEWSLNESRKIIHYRTDTANAVSFSHIASKIVDVAGSTRATYSGSVTNTSADPVGMSLDILCVSETGSTVQSYLRSKLWGVNHHYLALDVGQTKPIGGNLYCGPSGDEQHYLISPPDSRTLMSAFSMPKNLGLGAALEIGRLAGEGLFKSLEGKLKNDQDDYAVYRSLLAIPGTTNCSIFAQRISGRTNFLVCDVQDSNSLSGITSYFQQFESRLRAAVPRWYQVRELDSTDLPQFVVREVDADMTGATAMDLVIRKDSSANADDRYHLEFELRAPQTQG